MFNRLIVIGIAVIAISYPVLSQELQDTSSSGGSIVRWLHRHVTEHLCGYDVRCFFGRKNQIDSIRADASHAPSEGLYLVPERLYYKEGGTISPEKYSALSTCDKIAGKPILIGTSFHSSGEMSFEGYVSPTRELLAGVQSAEFIKISNSRFPHGLTKHRFTAKDVSIVQSRFLQEVTISNCKFDNLYFQIDTLLSSWHIKKSNVQNLLLRELTANGSISISNTKIEKNLT
ncbi:MAG: hypothetical protein M5R41_05110 [Bacteroidia bacterium]|nr:hypothetical protein [Bacteroidia bacterium]